MQKDVFISYKAEELEEARWVRDVLEANGISCWMAPDCIQGGASYASEIPQAIRGAKAFVLILSSKSQASKWVSREVDIAINEGKVILPFMLENCKLKDDFNFYLTNVQRYAAYENKSAAIEKMLRELKGIIGGGDGISFTASTPEKKEEKKEEVSFFKSKTFFLIAVAIVLVIAIVITVALPKDKDDASSPTATENPSDMLPPVYIAPEMSDELFDFTIDMGDGIIQLPCDYSVLSNMGWTISSSGTSDTSKVLGKETLSFNMSKNGKKIGVMVYNTSGHAREVKDCLVGGIEWDGSITDIKLAKGITVLSDVDAIVEAYGAPGYRNDGTDYVSLRYYSDKNNSNGVSFMCYTKADYLKYSSITVINQKESNEKTETKTERPEYLSKYVAPSSMGSGFSSVISVEGKLYELPAPVSEFINDGWNIKESSGDVPAGNTASITLSKGEARLSVIVKNYSEYQVAVENCAVYTVSVSDYDKVNVQIALGVDFNSSFDSINSSSDKLDYYEGSYSHMWSYSEYKERDYSINIDMEKETGKVSRIRLSNQNWSYK